MDNPKLNEIRKEINAIDNQLLPLLMRRMDACLLYTSPSPRDCS